MHTQNFRTGLNYTSILKIAYFVFVNSKPSREKTQTASLIYSHSMLLNFHCYLHLFRICVAPCLDELQLKTTWARLLNVKYQNSRCRCTFLAHHPPEIEYSLQINDLKPLENPLDRQISQALRPSIVQAGQFYWHLTLVMVLFRFLQINHLQTSGQKGYQIDSSHPHPSPRSDNVIQDKTILSVRTSRITIVINSRYKVN